MGGAVVCLFSKFVLMFVWFIMVVMMGFRGGYYYYLPSEVGGGVATGVSNRYVGIGVASSHHTPVSASEEDEEENAPSQYGASVVRLFSRTNPIHVDMDVPMENRWRQVQMGYQLAVYQ
jgi:hypothetical protein